MLNYNNTRAKAITALRYPAPCSIEAPASLRGVAVGEGRRVLVDFKVGNALEIVLFNTGAKVVCGKTVELVLVVALRVEVTMAIVELVVNKIEVEVVPTTLVEKVVVEVELPVRGSGAGTTGVVVGTGITSESVEVGGGAALTGAPGICRT